MRGSAKLSNLVGGRPLSKPWRGAATPSGTSPRALSDLKPSRSDLHYRSQGRRLQSALLGRIQMKAFTLGAAITLAFSAAAYAQAPAWTVPEESQRCPSKWGAADERGSGNHQKPTAVMN